MMLTKIPWREDAITCKSMVNIIIAELNTAAIIWFSVTADAMTPMEIYNAPIRIKEIYDPRVEALINPPMDKTKMT